VTVSLWAVIPDLVGVHIRLRAMRPSDADAIVAAASDGKLWELFFTGVPSAETIEAYLKAAFLEQTYGRAMPFVIIDKASDRIIGATRYMRMQSEARRLEIGATFYAQSVQRTSANTEAKLLLLTHAFETMDCLCVQFRTDHFNHASQRAIERLGAKRDGLIRNHNIMNGRVRDTVLYSIIASEWAGVKRNLEFKLARMV
jgi:N-acetyltransferase